MCHFNSVPLALALALALPTKRYTKEHLACFYEETRPPSDKPYYNYSMLPIYQKLAGKLRNIVVFNGDTDPDVQYRGTESCLESLGLPTLR